MGDFVMVVEKLGAAGWAEVRGSDCEVTEERKEQLGRTWWVVERKA